MPETSDKFKNQSILYYLPRAFLRSENTLLLATVYTLNKIYEERFGYWQELDVSPMTCNELILDWLALQGVSPWRNLWLPDLEVSTKRLLLRDANIIFQKRLFPETISLLFKHFNLRSRLVPKIGLILGITLIPAIIGTSILDYQVELPIIYQGSIEEKYTKYIVDNFGMPGYIPFIYV